MGSGGKFDFGEAAMSTRETTPRGDVRRLILRTLPKEPARNRRKPASPADVIERSKKMALGKSVRNLVRRESKKR
jgi:hypothetical protein